MSSPPSEAAGTASPLLAIGRLAAPVVLVHGALLATWDLGGHPIRTVALLALGVAAVAWVAIRCERERALSLGGLWGELRGLRYSFWGLFGWFNIALPRWMYGVFDGLGLVAVGWWLVANETILRPQCHDKEPMIKEPQPSMPCSCCGSSYRWCC